MKLANKKITKELLKLLNKSYKNQFEVFVNSELNLEDDNTSFIDKDMSIYLYNKGRDNDYINIKTCEHDIIEISKYQSFGFNSLTILLAFEFKNNKITFISEKSEEFFDLILNDYKELKEFFQGYIVK